jgi:two-component system OmpR family sensor kinase
MSFDDAKARFRFYPGTSAFILHVLHGDYLLQQNRLRRWSGLMRRPHSIRHHLAGVFLGFFVLVCVLGAFSIWRLSNFNLLSANVAEIWLPTTRALGDLNNYTSDFRAIEGGNLLSSNPEEAAATEQQMADLDRFIATAEREFEVIPHEAAAADLYSQFKTHWTAYRAIVNQMLALSRSNRKADAIAVYGGTSRVAYDAASDTLGQLTDEAVASAQAASDGRPNCSRSNWHRSSDWRRRSAISSPWHRTSFARR